MSLKNRANRSNSYLIVKNKRLFISDTETLNEYSGGGGRGLSDQPTSQQPEIESIYG